jgi:hypothetical protein
MSRKERKQKQRAAKLDAKRLREEFKSNNG